ncbi:MAG: GGDEF domain-containing protein, partial [Rhodanobacter sp.]|nr:GGDEF domain-containing protein [Rhodanobacter sp.]
MLVVLLGFAAGMVRAADSDAAAPAALLAQAENARVTDHPLFLSLLSRLHQEQAPLSPQQRWHLRYLDAWQTAFSDKLDQAAPVLRDIIAHVGDATLATRSSALLINVLARGRHYEEAYQRANQLIATLPAIANPKARAEALRAVVQMFSLAGQNDLALKYAKQMKAEIVPGDSRCAAYSYELNALSEADKLSSANPELRSAIRTCLADKQAVFANTLRLDRAYLLTDEGHPDQAVALLQRIEPSIRRSGFQPHIVGRDVALALAYVGVGNDARAREAALAAVAASDAGSLTWPLQTAYELLYEIEKRAGHDRAALTYYEKYMVQYKAAMDDAKTRALAYQMIRQDVLSKKLKLDALGKQNRILELRQELASQAQKTSRLYIALLLVVIAFIVAALFWLRRSQLRFRRMARHDGLTGSFNREYFFDEAERTLRRLHKANADACLVVLDMDHFKCVNDTYGHAAGDEVLRRAVAICRRELRGSDVFGRLGGEEFGILMSACSREQGITITTRIRRVLAATPMAVKSRTSIMVSGSFGLACSST